MNSIEIKIKTSINKGGFFHCCLMKFAAIIQFIQKYNCLPNNINENKSFYLYKPNNKLKHSHSVVHHYFFLIQNKIELEKFNKTNDFFTFIQTIKASNISGHSQFCIYSQFPFNIFQPIIKLYFEPINIIQLFLNKIKNKYLIEYKNTCVLFHRGNDKITETKICSYKEQYEHALQIYNKNKNIQFLIQSDEREFIEFMISKFPNNSFYFKDEIICHKKSNKIQVIINNSNIKNRILYTQYFLAITIIMSRCCYVICGSGNCDFWIMMFRGHAKNVIQYYNGIWYNSC